MACTIGITDCSKWENYNNWIQQGAQEMSVIRLSSHENNAGLAEQCSGIILTGGEDVHPSYYNKSDYVARYNLKDLNIKRDEFEFSALKKAVARDIPILGICRGLQVVNVFLGGTLIPDLPSINKHIHSSANGKGDTSHALNLTKGSMLYKLTEGKEDHIWAVRSHHHQAADILGNGLIVTALSDDGIAEGIEKESGKSELFFVLVQWHPERMNEGNPMSGALRDSFLDACKKYEANF